MSDYQKPLVTIELAEYQGMIKMLETYEASFNKLAIQDLFERILGVLLLPPWHYSFNFEPTTKQWHTKEELFPIINEILRKSEFTYSEDHPNGKILITRK